ncbi:MAG TPA: antibiotic biosynthesis monooxygenase [Ktedonobacteraceae bacterium]|jgi:quinol monooxygenase YgiN|nr:antibiotic biosynthesis monooxygenase [Ktedonobacteraceae bacterium]
MELLVVTLAHTNAENDPETAARVRMVAETTRLAPGLVNIRSYQSRGKETYYALLSTWDDEESWLKAQERHSPRQQLINAAAKQLVGEPEQWYLHYLWGYTRPASAPDILMLQLATVRPDKIEQAQQLWLKSLNQLVGETPLAYAFFARGVHEDHIPTYKPGAIGGTRHKETSYLQGVVLLNLLSWGSEREREALHTLPLYQQTNAFINSVSVSRLFALEPC